MIYMYTYLQNLNKDIWTTDKCKTTKVMALKITHWDVASQKVMTTVGVCDPSQVDPDAMMRFQVDVCCSKNSMATELGHKDPKKVQKVVTESKKNPRRRTLSNLCGEVMSDIT